MGFRTFQLNNLMSSLKMIGSSSVLFRGFQHSYYYLTVCSLDYSFVGVEVGVLNLLRMWFLIYGDDQEWSD